LIIGSSIKGVWKNLCGKPLVIKEIVINGESLFDLKNNSHREANYRNERKKKCMKNRKLGGVLVF